MSARVARYSSSVRKLVIQHTFDTDFLIALDLS